MLKVKLQCSGHLMWRTDSLEKTLMLGKVEGGRRRGWQRMRWLDGNTDSMKLSLVNSGSWWWTVRLEFCSPWGRKESHTTHWLNWTEPLLQIAPLASPYLLKNTKLFSLWFFVWQSFLVLEFLRISYHALIVEWQPVWRKLLFSKFEVLSFNAFSTLPCHHLIHSRIIVTLMHKEHKEEILKAYKSKEQITYKETRIRLIDFSKVTLGAGNTFIRWILNLWSVHIFLF